MKRIHKIILLFVAIFLIGIISFAGYINYSLDRKEVSKAADSLKTEKKINVKTIILY
ncbi:MAG: hypothetical protein KDD04_04445 [Sinomicrobium sp.]|nr:hypothetical protein [Sinomicrobium sp.]